MEDDIPCEIYPRVKVSPLVEIFGVTIHCDDRGLRKYDQPCEIFGCITVTEKLAGKPDTFDIYYRDRDNPESIRFGDPLMLTARSDAKRDVIIPSKDIFGMVLLCDRARNIIIAKGFLSLNQTAGEDWSEYYQDIRIQGEYGFYAEVHYAIFPYAVSATVRVLFFSKDDDFDTVRNDDCYNNGVLEIPDEMDRACYEKNNCSITANLYGTVSAASAINGNVGKNPYHSTLLFDKSVEDSVLVKSGDFIELSRSVVAVPAYSSFKVKATFYNVDTEFPVASGIVEFKPKDRNVFMKDIVGVNGRIRVQVVWSDAYEQVIRQKGPSHITSETVDSGEDSVKWQRLLLEQHSVERQRLWPSHIAALSAKCILPCKGYEACLMELFSVVVCSKDKPLKLYGKITVHYDGPYCIFNKHKSTPLDCPKSGMLAIVEAPFSYTNLEYLIIRLDLKDVTGRIISAGQVSFEDIDIHKYGNMRLCAIVRGDLGFAAFHFSLFPDGVSAQVRVVLHGKSLPGRVRGKIYAYARDYDSSEPVSCHQEELFKSLLFYDVHDGVLLDSGSNVPLVKYLVSLPRRSVLVIEANLLVSPVGSINGDLALKDSVVLGSNGDSPRKMGNNDLYTEVEVKFSAYI